MVPSWNRNYWPNLSTRLLMFDDLTDFWFTIVMGTYNWLATFGINVTKSKIPNPNPNSPLSYGIIE